MSQKRPGMMLYFDLLSALETLEPHEQGTLLMALLHYGMTGAEPRFTDRTLVFAWEILKKRSDSDEERYDEKVRQSKDAANRRWTAERERTASAPKKQPVTHDPYADLDKYMK